MLPPAPSVARVPPWTLGRGLIASGRTSPSSSACHSPHSLLVSLTRHSTMDRQQACVCPPSLLFTRSPCGRHPSQGDLPPSLNMGPRFSLAANTADRSDACSLSPDLAVRSTRTRASSARRVSWQPFASPRTPSSPSSVPSLTRVSHLGTCPRARRCARCGTVQILTPTTRAHRAPEEARGGPGRDPQAEARGDHCQAPQPQRALERPRFR